MNKTMKRIIIGGLVAVQLVTTNACFAKTIEAEDAAVYSNAVFASNDIETTDDASLLTETIRTGERIGVAFMKMLQLGVINDTPMQDTVWESSDERIVRIVKTSGEYNSEAELKAGKVPGKCTVVGKMGDEIVYAIKIYVVRDNVVRKYTGKTTKASLVAFHEENYNVEVNICNGSKKNIDYSDKITLKKYVNGKWKTIKKKSFIDFNNTVKVLKSKKSITKNYVLTWYYDKENLKAGKYRLYVDCPMMKKTSNYVNFKIK